MSEVLLSEQPESRASLDLPEGRPVGLVAGWGRFPVSVAETLARRGHPVYCIAIRGHALSELETVCQSTLWSGVGRFGRHIRFFKRHGIGHVTLAGKLFKSELLYHGSLLLKHRPDWTCLKTFWPLLMGPNRDARDDRLLGAVIDTYQRNAMRICAATELAPDLLVDAGVLTQTQPQHKQTRDMELGWEIAKAMGGFDIGQAITIKDGTVLAVEAIEGTDACIQRTGELCPRGGWTLIKVSKPNQDMRFDVPTIGTRTVDRVQDAGGTMIAIEANKTILLDQAETIRRADQHGITIVAR
ncbi:MAG: UDP-2,3-diacylglucosamine diphosphatase LpxI [Planctomycetota bacterium]